MWVQKNVASSTVRLKPWPTSTPAPCRFWSYKLRPHFTRKLDRGREKNFHKNCASIVSSSCHDDCSGIVIELHRCRIGMSVHSRWRFVVSQSAGSLAFMVGTVELCTQRMSGQRIPTDCSSPFLPAHIAAVEGSRGHFYKVQLAIFLRHVRELGFSFCHGILFSVGIGSVCRTFQS